VDDDEDLKPTPEQQDIIDAFATGSDVAAVALAGTGKTSTQRLVAGSTRQRGLYLAFNKSIAEEAEATFPGRVKAMTINAMAYRAVDLPRDSRRRLIRLDKTDYLPPWDVAKKFGITSPLYYGDKELKPTRQASIIREMVTKFCYSDDDEVMLEHVPFIRGLDAVKEGDETVDVHPDLARELLPYAQAYWRDVSAPEGSFRFEHDHYLKKWALTRPQLQRDYLLIDEAQDLNPVIIRLINEQTGMQKLICGDGQQQIYQWRGSVNAMDVLQASYYLPLTQSWRFGQEIADVANEFLTLLGNDYLLRGNPGKISFAGNDPVGADAILTRTNAGALSALIREQRLGRRVAMEGRAKEVKDFCAAAEKMMRGEIVTHRDLQMFSSWSEVQDYAEEGHDAAFSALVKLVSKYTPAKLLAALINLVPADVADVVISTAHSAKGLEWGNVEIGPDYVVTDKEGNVVPPSRGELRLRYVAVTRAKDQLDVGSLADELGYGTRDEVAQDTEVWSVAAGQDAWKRDQALSWEPDK
jgi:hypothetical protein